MGFKQVFAIGDVVTSQSIVAEFRCGSMDDICSPKTPNTLVLITNNNKGLYEDTWIKDELHYTGMGKAGDQDINFVQNYTLSESQNSGVDVHLFEVFTRGSYIYSGIAELRGEPYQETQNDVDGNPRNVWMFPLHIQKGQSTLPEEIISQRQAQSEQETRRLSTEVILSRAQQQGQTTPGMRRVRSKMYMRNPYVSEYAKRRVAGYCQLCESAAPFMDKSGKPNLEIHHIVWLSRGDTGTIEYTAALCPNYHCKMHLIDDTNDIEVLTIIAEEDELLKM